MAAVVGAIVINLIIAAITHAAGASDAFQPLKPGTFIVFTVIGMVLGTCGWAIVRRTDHAARTLRWLAPTVLALSLVPDLLVGMNQSMTGASWTAVVGLMAMHVVVAGVLIAALVKVMPLASTSGTTADHHS